MSPGSAPTSSTEPSSSSTWAQSPQAQVQGQGQSYNQGLLPLITNQPPTPASQASPGGSDDAPPTPSASTSQGPPVPVWDQREDGQGLVGGGGAPGLRGRSATFNAKRAVADVVRRYHPESGAQQVQGQGQVPSLGGSVA
jgi:hypothetical protein